MPSWGELLRRHKALNRSLQAIGSVWPVQWLRRRARRLMFGTGRGRETSDSTTIDHFENVTLPASVCGTLVVSLFDEKRPHGGRPEFTLHTHEHVWVRNSDYSDMEDNDLRGFLDGRWKFGWNQPTQIHVRLGRVRTRSALGEFELFRILQRWNHVTLPAGARVSQARLELAIERGGEYPLELFVYQVHKDWNPGHGGKERNNNSTPADGEVWWNEIGHRGQVWGLPGAGFASDSHPAADTPEMPLARARYSPGDQQVSFGSARLAAYVEERVAAGLPLLFLFKLADYVEDIPGSVLHVFSANHGDSQTERRRPRLVLQWQSKTESSRAAHECLIEHGRLLTLPRIECQGAKFVALSFSAREESEPPTLWIRGGQDRTSSDWRMLAHPVEIDWSWLEIRVEARVKPLPLGTVFEAVCRDTWVTTGPKETQRVTWTFTSPSGKTHLVLADYIGGSAWQVRFSPAEIGRWRYEWTQDFIEIPYRSPEGVFDVWSSDPAQIRGHLEELAERARASDLAFRDRRVAVFGVLFNRLQRALMRIQTPESFPRSATHSDGGDVAHVLDPVRQALSGKPVDKPRLKLD